MTILRKPSDLELIFMNYNDFKPSQQPNDNFFRYNITTIETNKSVFVIGYILINYLNHLNALIIKINQNKFTIKAEVFVNYIKCIIKIRIYTNNIKYFIEIHRYSGDLIAFNQIYYALKKIFSQNHDINISEIKLSIFTDNYLKLNKFKYDYNLEFYDIYLYEFIFNLANEINDIFEPHLYKKNNKIINRLELCINTDISNTEIIYPTIIVLLKFSKDIELKNILTQFNFIESINKHLDNINIYPYLKKKLEEIKYNLLN